MAVLAALALSACGGGSSDDGNPSGGAKPQGAACPPETNAILKDAKERMSHSDYDGAFAVMNRVGDCPRVQKKLAQYKPIAAKQTLDNAHKRLESAHRRHDSPQPAVALAKNSLKYQDTPEARAFLKKVEAELEAFKREHGPKPDEEQGGPSDSAGGKPAP